LKRDTRGDIRLNESGDDVYGRPLGGEDEVYADRAAHLRQPDDSRFKLPRIGLHDIRKLVDDNDYVGHSFGAGESIISTRSFGIFTLRCFFRFRRH
jgi:hypothetical protein